MNRLLDHRAKSTRSTTAHGARPGRRFKDNAFATQKNPFENEMLKKRQGLEDLDVLVEMGISTKGERDRWAICSPGASKTQAGVTNQAQLEKQRTPQEGLVADTSHAAITSCNYNSNLHAQLNIVAPSSY